MPTLTKRLTRRSVETLRQALEWGIIIFLFFSVYQLLSLPLPPPGSPVGPVAQLVGFYGSVYFYSLLFGVEAFLLTYAKVFKKKTLHKWTLLAICLTNIFNAGLTITLRGWNERVPVTLLIAAVSGASFLWWKMKTEYVSIAEMTAEAVRLKHGPTPSEDRYYDTDF